MKNQKTITLVLETPVYQFQIIREFRVIVAEEFVLDATSDIESDHDIIYEMLEDEKRFPAFEVNFPECEGSSGGFIADIELLDSRIEEVPCEEE